MPRGDRKLAGRRRDLEPPTGQAGVVTDAPASRALSEWMSHRDCGMTGRSRAGIARVLPVAAGMLCPLCQLPASRLRSRNGHGHRVTHVAANRIDIITFEFVIADSAFLTQFFMSWI